jgi:hypothetical protein
MKRIEITISPTGDSRIETSGFSGPSCQEASRFLEQALGQKLSEQLTVDFFATQETSQSHQQRS